MSQKNSESAKIKGNASVHLTLATSFRELGLVEEAVREYAKAARLSDDKLPIYRQLAEFHKSVNQTPEALAVVRKMLRIRPTDAQTRELMVEILIEMGRFDDAIAESRTLLRANPRNISTRDWLYYAYLQKGMFDQAVEAATEMIYLDPASPANHYKKAFAHHEQGDIGSAIHELGRVLEMKPDEEMAQVAQSAIERLDAQQIRRIVMLAIEDATFRIKLLQDAENAVEERGYYLSYAGVAALKQIRFDELPELYSESRHHYYH